MIKILDMNQVYNSCIREYMTGVDRTNRDYKTQEVFTPDWMVDIILNEIQNFSDLDEVYLDRAVGDGQFVSKILIAKMLHYQSKGMEVHQSFHTSLDTIFGVDIERDNVILCRKRLLCGCTDPKIVSLVNRRILIGDSINPRNKVKGQNEQDYNLMIKYFSKKLDITN